MIVANTDLDAIPDNCIDCPYFDWTYCAILGTRVHNATGAEIVGEKITGRDEDCPLMEIKPTKTHYDKDDKPIIKGYIQYL